jgi:hypothetical protein
MEIIFVKYKVHPGTPRWFGVVEVGGPCVLLEWQAAKPQLGQAKVDTVYFYSPCLALINTRGHGHILRSISSLDDPEFAAQLHCSRAT